MNFKLILIYFVFQTLKSISARSFTLILDTTVSMQEELDIIRRNLPTVVNYLRNATDFDDFIVVPFNDPDVGTPIISSTPDQLVESLKGLTMSGGHDCPEDSLSGIEKGLELSKPESFIYVFTDAYAKDDSKFRSIESLCKSSRSQVVIFLSGICSGHEPNQRGNVDVYYDIAKTCSGAVFKFDALTLRKAFKYIKEMVTAHWNDITSYDPFTGYQTFTFSVDTFTKDFLVAVSGDYPTLQIVDAAGKSPEIQKIVDTRQSLIVRVANFNSGTYQTSVRCQGATSLTFYKRNQMQFEYGFSTRQPQNLRETSLRPMPGWVNYILIVLPPTYNIQITALELQMPNRDVPQALTVQEIEKKHGFYISSVFMEPDKSFKCVIHGRDSTTYEEISGSTRLVDVQKPVQNNNITWTRPVVEIIEPENNLVDFGTNTVIACKVKGYPKPEIKWEDDAESVLTTEEILLEIPSTYISYVTVNVTTNSTIYCKAVNAEGDDTQSVDLFVNRPFTFEIVETPKDETFEYGSEGKMYCKVDAYPEVEIKWYHNDTVVESSDNIELLSDEFALVIKNMTMDDVGSYKCEATNAVKSETFVGEVTISGLEAPEVEIENTELILKPGDWKDIECRIVKGNPTPEIAWKYQSADEYDFESSLPSEVYAEENKLKIPAVTTDHKGTYRCVATNMMGEGFRDVTVKIQYAPKITSTDDGTLAVMEGDPVELKCDVDATPKATVRWEMTQDDVIMTLDDRHRTDDSNTHRFNALWRDSGNYHCIAENELGQTKKTVTVNVLVAPFIQPPVSTMVEVAAGSSISLECNVLFGNPVPTTKWEFIAHDSTTSVLSRGNSKTAYLHLNNISRANEGMYLCIADNQVGNDRIRIYLRIK